MIPFHVRPGCADASKVDPHGNCVPYARKDGRDVLTHGHHPLPNGRPLRDGACCVPVKFTLSFHDRILRRSPAVPSLPIPMRQHLLEARLVFLHASANPVPQLAWDSSQGPHPCQALPSSVSFVCL